MISGENSNQLLSPVETVAVLTDWYPRTSFRRQGEMWAHTVYKYPNFSPAGVADYDAYLESI